MSYSIIAIPVMLLLVIIIFAIPVMIGVYVYKDALSRNMNAALWTVVSILAPGFIGLIIYLIVRSDHSALKCPGCGAGVKESFSVCPLCGMSLKSTCEKCGFPLESNWVNCPNCAEPIDKNKIFQSPVYPQKKDKGLSRLLIAIIIIPLIICLILFLGVVSLRSFSSGTATSLVSYTKEEITSKVVLNWINDCDKAGSGIYVFSDDKNLAGAESPQTSYFIYCNNGDYDVLTKHEVGGWIKSSVFELQLYKADGEDEDKDYSLFYYHAEGANVKNSKIKLVDKNGKELPFTQYTSENYSENIIDILDAYNNGAYLDIEFEKEIDDIKNISYTLYYDGEITGSGDVTNAAEGLIKDNTVSFYFYTDRDGEFDAVSFSVTDKTDKVVFESDKYDLYMDDGGVYVLLGYKNGKIVCLDDYE